MKLIVLMMLMFMSSQTYARKCCKMIVGGTIVDKFLGGGGSALVKKHQDYCAKIDERWKNGGAGHSECIWSPGIYPGGAHTLCNNKEEKACKGNKYCIWDKSRSKCSTNYTNFNSFCASTTCKDTPLNTKGCCGLNDNQKDNPNALNMFNQCQKYRDKQSCVTKYKNPNGSYCQWNSNNICKKPEKIRVVGQGCCGVSQDAIASTKKFYPSKLAEQVNMMLKSCKGYDRNPKMCEGDCQWYADKTKCKPLPEPVPKGCCGMSDLARKKAKNFRQLMGLYQRCNNKQSSACRETSQCSWQTDLKKCKEPKEPQVVGCCGVKKNLRNHRSLLRFLNTCNQMKNPGSCENDRRSARVCQWFVNVNDCKIQTSNIKGPSTNISGTVNVKKPKGKSGIIATAGCPKRCAVQANANCPQLCEITCVPRKFMRGPILKKLKVIKNKTIVSGSCQDYAKKQSRGRYCKVTKCLPARQPN
jgi:hypothetical protein